MVRGPFRDLGSGIALGSEDGAWAAVGDAAMVILIMGTVIPTLAMVMAIHTMDMATQPSVMLIPIPQSFRRLRHLVTSRGCS